MPEKGEYYQGKKNSLQILVNVNFVLCFPPMYFRVTLHVTSRDIQTTE